MTVKTDALIVRQWAEANINAFTPTPMTLAQRNAIAAHILATTTPLTMADIAWDDEAHSGLCAEHCDGDEVLMLGPDLDNADTIICHWTHYGLPVTEGLPAEKLTPIPGTKIDLTPRRESVPESAPGHPEFLETDGSSDGSSNGPGTTNDDRNEDAVTSNDRPATLITAEDRLPGKRAVVEAIRLRREIESLRADCYQTVIDPRGHEDLTPDGAAHHVALDCFARLTRILEGEG